MLSSFAISTPTNPDGSVDTKTLQDWGGTLARNMMMFKTGIYPQLIKDASTKQGGLSILMNPDGSPKNTVQAAKDVAAAPDSLTADQRQSAMSRLTTVQNAMER